MKSETRYCPNFTRYGSAEGIPLEDFVHLDAPFRHPERSRRVLKFNQDSTRNSSVGLCLHIYKRLRDYRIVDNLIRIGKLVTLRLVHTSWAGMNLSCFNNYSSATRCRAAEYEENMPYLAGTIRLASNVTAVCARALPFNFAPVCTTIAVWSNIFPLNTDVVPSVV